MVSRRHYVYISSYSHEVQLERIKLEKFLLDLEAFPWGLRERRSTSNTRLVRREIIHSDYVIFLLGGKYGELSLAALSYMHLDFIFALSKNKIILSLLHSDSEKKPPCDSQSQPDLIKKYEKLSQIFKRDSHYYTEYRSLLNLETAVQRIFGQLVKKHPQSGWIRDSSRGISLDKQPSPVITHLNSDLGRAKGLNAAATSTSPQTLTQLVQDAKYTVSYRGLIYHPTHPQEIWLQHEFEWMAILRLLAPYFESENIESNFARALNFYLESFGLVDVPKTLLEVPRITQVKIDEQCLQTIKMQMKWNNWIVPVNSEKFGARSYWQLSDDAKDLLRRG